MASQQVDGPRGTGCVEPTRRLSETRGDLSEESLGLESLNKPKPKSLATTPDAQSDVAEEILPGSTPGSGPFAEDGKEAAFRKLQKMEEIALHALHVEDNPSLNPWTFRTWLLGLGLSAFSATLATVYQFKPQVLGISSTFLVVVSYALALLLELIPRKGWLGRLLNPHPFHAKEHVAILVMSQTAAHSARAVSVLAVQRLWYNTLPSTIICILLIFSSQCLGYGIAGLLRKVLVYPTKFVFPHNLPIMSLLETLHRKKMDMRFQMKLFYWVFIAIFLWETVPEYLMPVLTAVSVFCLAQRNDMNFTRIFGGGNGNEGLGVLSFCFDFQYITSAALFLPAVTIFNACIGYILCIIVFASLYYGNVWRARDFPFLSQLMFSPSSNGTHYVRFNQTAVLNSQGQVNEAKLMQHGIPYISATFASHNLTENMALTATITHLLLYNWDDVKSAFAFLSRRNLGRFARPEVWMFWKKKEGEETTEKETGTLDPHYLLMRVYRDVPDWWYASVFVIAVATGILCIYQTQSGMQWWEFIVTTLLACVMIVFTGAQSGLTGFTAPISSLAQMIGAYLEPGRPVANMYFTLFGHNSVSQALLLLTDLKLGQYAKLPPRCTFTMQLVGTLVGGIINYIVMLSITSAQRDILLSIEGTHIWSGASLQSFNTQAVTWGGLAKYMYSLGSTYQWVPLALALGFVAPLPIYFCHRLWPKLGLDKINVPIIAGHIGLLCVGINSSALSFFLVAFWSSFYLRRYKPEWFLKYNYVLCAGLDGGTQVIVFIMTFVFFGASGKPIPFPTYWGNPRGNVDYCMNDPAL